LKIVKPSYKHTYHKGGVFLKVTIRKVSELDEVCVEIQCQEVNQEVKDIERMLSLYALALPVKREGRNYTLTPREIYYFEAINHDVFAYTKEHVYEVSYKLYQLETMYQDLFIRVSKNTLVNPRVIQSFFSSINGRMEATLLNKERLVISRMYVANLKRALKGEKA